jgi:hypothetical protein
MVLPRPLPSVWYGVEGSPVDDPSEPTGSDGEPEPPEELAEDAAGVREEVLVANLSPQLRIVVLVGARADVDPRRPMLALLAEPLEVGLAFCPDEALRTVG